MRPGQTASKASTADLGSSKTPTKAPTTKAANIKSPASKTESGSRPFAISNTNLGVNPSASATNAPSPSPSAALPTPPSHSDQIKAALDTLGIKLIKSEAERDVLKKLVEETRASQARLERELLENRKELAEQRRRVDDQRKETEQAKSRHERLEERLRESQAGNLKLTRKLEADEQKRTRLQRRMERLEAIAKEAQDSLQSRAFVLMTDQTLAQKSGLPHLPATGALPAPLQGDTQTSGPLSSFMSPSAYGTIDIDNTQTSNWWQRPLRLTTTTALVALTLALGFGWLISSALQDKPQTALAFLQDGSLARIDLRDGSMAPLQLSLKPLDTNTTPASRPNITDDGQPLPTPKPESQNTQSPENAPARDESLTGALKDLQDKAYSGIPEAQHDLAAIYTAGSGVKQDYERATYWFTEAALAGIGNAAYNLGVLHHQGLGTAKDIDTALNWYRIAAVQGHPEAQYNLGIAYIEGIGTKYNPQLAAGFFKNAALSGIAEAAYNLGLILENGLLAEPRPNQALIWYRTGADIGSDESLSALTSLATRLGLNAGQAGYLPDGTSLAKLVQKPGRTETVALEPTETPDIARVMPELSEMIPNPAQLITAQIQEQLSRRTLYSGAEDGAMSNRTVSAIKAYEKSAQLPQKGEPTTDILMHMLKSSVQ